MEQYVYDVFISYSRKDTETANKITQAFDQAGITYFIDRQGIGGGMEFPAVLAKAIRESKVFLFLASKNSYESKFTQSEIVYAFNKKEKHDIIPYIIDGSTLPDELEFTFSSINWRRIEQHPIETTLVNDILHKLGRPTIEDSPLLDNPNSVKSSKRKSFSGKTLAWIILCLSIAFLVLAIVLLIACKNNPIDHFRAFENTYFLTMCILLLLVLIGFIRPNSLDLTGRKDVAKFYLISFGLLFFACVIIANIKSSQDTLNKPVVNETEVVIDSMIQAAE